MPELNQPPFHVLLCSRAVPNAAAVDRYRRSGIEPISLGYHKLDPRNLFKLIRIMRREKIDILHLHGYGACTWGRIAGHLLRTPAIVHERCNYVTVPWFQRPVEFILGPFTRYAYAVSESTRQFTIKKRYIPERVVKTLYSGIPLDSIPVIDENTRRETRKARGVGDDAFLLGVVSRLEPHKGHEDLLNALTRIRDQIPNVKVWIIGDGYHQSALEAKSEELGLKGMVEFLGYQSHVWPLVQSLDLQVFPSHQEGTPNTLYEAMAVGNAIIASTADGQGEILTHEKDALLYPPGDISRLADGILRLYGDPELRVKLRAKARNRIGDFDMKKTIATLRDAYVKIAGRV